MERVCLQADYNHYNLVQAGRIRDDSGLKFHIRRNFNLAPECENAKGPVSKSGQNERAGAQKTGVGRQDLQVL